VRFSKIDPAHDLQTTTTYRSKQHPGDKARVTVCNPPSRHDLPLKRYHLRHWQTPFAQSRSLLQWLKDNVQSASRSHSSPNPAPATTSTANLDQGPHQWPRLIRPVAGFVKLINSCDN